ncbi:unnamed protein product [Choristocarpus tenellus]
MLLDLETRREEISGQRLWEGSLLLCRYLLQACANGDLDLREKSVVELGAGTGIAGMLARGLGARPTVITDGDDRVVNMAKMNLVANAIPPSEALATVLRWGDSASKEVFLETLTVWRRETSEGRDSSPGGEHNESRVEQHQGPLPPPFDLVIAGDVLYKPSLLHPLLETAKGLLMAGVGEGGRDKDNRDCRGERRVRMIICHVPRAGVTHKMVEEVLTSTGFEFKVVGGKGGEREEECDGGVNVGGVDLCVEDALRARLYSIGMTGNIIS